MRRYYGWTFINCNSEYLWEIPVTCLWYSSWRKLCFPLINSHCGYLWWPTILPMLVTVLCRDVENSKEGTTWDDWCTVDFCFYFTSICSCVLILLFIYFCDPMSTVSRYQTEKWLTYSPVTVLVIVKFTTFPLLYPRVPGKDSILSLLLWWVTMDYILL